VAGRDQFGQHHREGLEGLDFLLVVLAARAVLHHQDAEHATRAHDRHAGQRVIDFLTRLGAIGELWMGLRVVERQRPAVGRDVADETLADPEAGTVHRRGIEALRREQFQHLAGAQQVDRADLGHHLVGDQAHDLGERVLDGTRTRHRVPEPLEEHSRSGRWSCSLHGQTAGYLSRMTTKLRSMAQAQARHAADARATRLRSLVGRALRRASWMTSARMVCL
jgi:hypothetical protein